MTNFTHSLTTDPQKTAASVLGQAFANDPFMTYLLPKSETRVHKLTKLFLPLIRVSQHWNGVEMAPNGGGVLLWIPGRAFTWSSKIAEVIRSGLMGLPWSIGVSACKRLQIHDSACEDALKQHAPTDFAYLWVVGVHSDYAGQGLGKQMIQTALDKMRRRGHSVCFLRTENPKNIGLYEHLGFKQVFTETPSASGFQYWLMSQDL